MIQQNKDSKVKNINIEKYSFLNGQYFMMEKNFAYIQCRTFKMTAVILSGLKINMLGSCLFLYFVNIQPKSF